jgi:protein TonB
MDDSFVYRKTSRGAMELAATHSEALSRMARGVLILLDGQRSVAELAGLLGAEQVRKTLSELEAQGFARRVGTVDSEPTTWSPGTAGGAQPNDDKGPNPRPHNESATTRRGLNRVATAFFLAALAIAGAAVMVFRTDQSPGRAVASAGASGRAVASVPEPETPRSDAPSGDSPVREMPLSGLPAVTVTPTQAHRAEDRPPATAPSPPAAEAKPVGPRETVPPDFAPGTAAPSIPIARDASDAVPIVHNQIPLSQPSGGATPTPVAKAESRPSEAPVSSSMPAAGPAAAADTPAAITAPAAPAAPRVEPVRLHARRHDPPRYPSRLLERDNVPEGRVLARIWVTAEGSVDRVEIVEATPPQVFDEEVRRALSTWTFDPPGRATDTTIRVVFKP